MSVRTKDRRRDERGGVTIVLSGVVAVAVMATFGVSRLGTAIVEDARVDAVADLVALAAVDAGDGAAAELSRRSGVPIEAIRHRPTGAITVVVARGRVRSSASARPW
ncbi:MAG: hypothetical protein ACKOYM_08265 [Actinomycetes bacterium]